MIKIKKREREAPAPDPNGSALLKVGDVAETLNVSNNTVYQWIKQGLLEAVNVSPNGKRPVWRVRKRDADELLTKEA